MSRPAIIVTGASRGLGQMICRILAERGSAVVGVSRSKPDFSHENYSHREADVSDEASVVALFQALKSEGLVLSTLINNAGVSLARPALFTGAKSFEDLLRINLIGAFLMA